MNTWSTWIPVVFSVLYKYSAMKYIQYTFRHLLVVFSLLSTCSVLLLATFSTQG